MKTINLEEILGSELNIDRLSPLLHIGIKRAMRTACERAIELCNENANLIWFDNAEIDHDSILDTKKQIV